jgi:cytochrome c-type biogenesis protein CcmE
MKTTRIIALLVIVVAASVIYTSLSASSRYADFSQAFEKPGEKFTVIGKLDRTKQMVDLPNHMEFYLLDEQNNLRKVIYNKTKPQDFERSEKIVMTGTAKGNDFLATELLLKCPSKYNNQNQ